MRHRPIKREALTLLEVVTALAIFLVGVTALFQLIQDGSYRAMRVDWKAQASLRCQSKLAELTVGWQELQSSELQAFPDDEGWQWRAQVDEEFEGLYRVLVEVQRELPNGEIIRSDLSQMLLPATSRGSSLDVASTPATKSSTAPPSESGKTDPATDAAPEATPAPAPMTAPPMSTTPTGTAPMGKGEKK